MNPGEQLSLSETLWGLEHGCGRLLRGAWPHCGFGILPIQSLASPLYIILCAQETFDE